MRGIDSLDKAAELSGLEVFVPEESLKPLEKDAFYHFQLIGCCVVTINREPVGAVKDILSIPENELLVVESGQQEFLIPLSGGICLEINLADKEIVIDPPDGLLDLNEI